MAKVRKKLYRLTTPKYAPLWILPSWIMLSESFTHLKKFITFCYHMSKSLSCCQVFAEIFLIWLPGCIFFLYYSANEFSISSKIKEQSLFSDESKSCETYNVSVPNHRQFFILNIHHIIEKKDPFLLLRRNVYLKYSQCKIIKKQ